MQIGKGVRPRCGIQHPPSSVLVSSISYHAKTKSKNCFIGFKIFPTSKIDQHVMVPSSYNIAPSSAILAYEGIMLIELRDSGQWSNRSCDPVVTWCTWVDT